jgi:AraC-like DNA-binding protein
MSMTIYDSVRKSIAFIEENLQKDIGVLDVANSVSYSQFYFSRQFSRHTRISIYDYILRRKISEAYKFLFQNNSKIIDLAYQYGFQSHEVFTRAFRKIFRENPSEASVYKPLAIYDSIDDEYLAFLMGLRAEIIDQPARDFFFEPDCLGELESQGSVLIQLSNDLFRCKNIFKGRLLQSENRFLSFKLCGLINKARIYHNDVKLSFRYFIDNIYDINEMGGNCIFMNKEEGHIDIMIPSNPQFPQAT